MKLKFIAFTMLASITTSSIAEEYPIDVLVDAAVDAAKEFKEVTYKKDMLYEEYSKYCAPTYSCTGESDKAIRVSGWKEASRAWHAACAKAKQAMATKKPTPKQIYQVKNYCDSLFQ